MPQLYLRHWLSEHGEVHLYRTVVSHPNVPLWTSRRSSKSVLSLDRLYSLSDSVGAALNPEEWFGRYVENPAADPLRRAVSDERMTRSDWQALILFLAAQDLRTPSRYLQQFKQWEKTFPEIATEAIREIEERVSGRGVDEESTRDEAQDGPIPLPLRVEVREGPDGDDGEIGVELTLGRQLWMREVHRMLTSTVRVLQRHRWTMLKPPHDMSWFTSDNPVVRLHYSGEEDYSLDGGWGRPGAEIFLPLSPEHLMYTRVGHPRHPRGTRVSRQIAERIQKMLAENARAMIIATAPDPAIVELRPRLVDAEAFAQEQQLWATWDDVQTSAEEGA